MRGFSRWYVCVVLVGLGLLLGGHRLSAQSGRRPSQGQAASQFLRAVLRADYAVAYGRLAPEVRHAISPAQFEAAARPLWRSGQRHGEAIELYKLGMRLGDQGASRLFYTFSFAADSARKPPPALLEVVFRDTASRAVLSFSQRLATPPARPPRAPGTSKKQPKI